MKCGSVFGYASKCTDTYEAYFVCKKSVGTFSTFSAMGALVVSPIIQATWEARTVVWLEKEGQPRRYIKLP